jgi:hypothetical protein
MSSYYANHSDIIYVKDLDARRKELFNRAGCLTEDEGDELAALVQFRADVFSECGQSNWTESRGFIADTYFDKYQYERQCDIYSKEIVDSPYWDDEQFTEDQQAEFTEIDFDGVTYWVDRRV